MPSYLTSLAEKGIAHPPKWLPSNVMFEAYVGSMAYGANEDDSDMDLYSFCIPKKEEVFPHLKNEIVGFGRQQKRFEQYLEHGLFDPSAKAGKGQEYDLTCYNIVKFFSLLMENNPNILDLLYVPTECITHSTPLSIMIREKRHLFLSKKLKHTHCGYAYAQLSKINNQKILVEKIRHFEQKHKISHLFTYEELLSELLYREKNSGYRVIDISLEELMEYRQLFELGLKESKRFYKRKLYGYDTKFALHLVRLICQAQQYLETGDMNMRRDSALLRDIRDGNWAETHIRSWFTDQEQRLTKLYDSCTILPHSPNEELIKELLLNCLEHHYGSLSGCVVQENKYVTALREISRIVNEANV